MTDEAAPLGEPIPDQLIRELFEHAQQRGGFGYTLALLRVEGIDERPDPLVKLEEIVQASWHALPLEERSDLYCLAAMMRDPLNLLWNLLNAASARTYKPFPFDHLIRATDHGYQQPTQRECLQETVRFAEETGQTSVRDALARCYAALLEGGCDEEVAPALRSTSIDDENARMFFKALVENYFAARKRFGDKSFFVKQPRFEVAEFLCDEHLGLYGLRVFFSNGSHAEWIRTRERATSVNVFPRDRVDFFVGSIDDLKREWRVGDKRLHEIGLPGRYNELGEWRPMVYEGSTEWMDEEIQTLTSDPDVQGALFYIYCTAHHLIEFVVSGDIDLPYDNPVQFGTARYPVHISKCPQKEGWDPHLRIYDGWVFLHSLSVKEIERALYEIGVAIGRLAFTFGVNVSWRMKYRAVFSPANLFLAKPDKSDVALLDRVLVSLPYIVDFAIDWYNRGRASRNPFTAFLCYFVAIEIIVAAAYDHDADIGLSMHEAGPAERRRQRVECIRRKHEELFASDPQKFVQTAYFDCIVPLSRRRREVCELVFGPTSSVITALFIDSEERPSLTALRDELAHGGVALIHRDDEALVRGRLGEISSISKEFLMRVILKLKPGGHCPNWSGQFTMSGSTADPRTTRVTSTLDIFPNKDWTIRPEWCD